jgi:hypothetical protein
MELSSTGKSKAILLSIFILNLLLHTFLRGKLGPYINPVLAFISSLALSIYPVFILKKHRFQFDYNHSESNFNWLPLIIFILGATSCTIFFNSIISNNPIDFKKSDIIPATEIFCQRFLNGESPYQVITDFGYNMYFGYFPLHWLPYSVSTFFGFDHRWVSFSAFMIVSLLYVFNVSRHHKHPLMLIFFSILPFFVLFIFMLKRPGIFENTNELLIASYYFLLAISIFWKSSVLRGVILSLPLLSRYSIVFWVPVYIIIIFILEKRKNALMIAGTTFFLVLTVYIIPFFLKDISYYSKSYDYYTLATIDEWHPQAWQGLNAKPFHLFNGVGFAAYFYDFINGSIEHRITVLKSTHLIISILSALIAGLSVIKLKKHIDYRLLLLLGLHFYLTFFYAFIQISYIYLYLIPIVISIVVFEKTALAIDYENIQFKK